MRAITMTFHRALAVIAWNMSACLANADPTDDEVRQASEALELFHIQHEVFAVVRCQNGKFDGQMMIRCHPALGGVPGNLWVLEDGPTLMALNGKALALLDRMRGSITDTNGDPVAVEDWRKHHMPDQMPDIPSALAALGYPE